LITLSRYLPVLVAGQPDKCLAPKNPAILPNRTAVDEKAVFQREDGMQTIAQIFHAANAPPVEVVRPAGLLDVSVPVLIVRVGDSSVQQTI
jgi:hypothetical protein